MQNWSPLWPGKGIRHRLSNVDPAYKTTNVGANTFLGYDIMATNGSASFFDISSYRVATRWAKWPKVGSLNGPFKVGYLKKGPFQVGYS